MTSVHCSLTSVHYSLTSVHWLLITDLWSLTSDHCSLTSVHYSLTSVHCSLTFVQKSISRRFLFSGRFPHRGRRRGCIWVCSLYRVRVVPSGSEPVGVFFPLGRNQGVCPPAAWHRRAKSRTGAFVRFASTAATSGGRVLLCVLGREVQGESPLVKSSRGRGEDGFGAFSSAKWHTWWVPELYRVHWSGCSVP